MVVTMTTAQAYTFHGWQGATYMREELPSHLPFPSMEIRPRVCIVELLMPLVPRVTYGTV